MGTHTFDRLREHMGHNVEVVGYGEDEIVNVAIECETCGTVLKDIDKPEDDAK